MGLPPDTGVGPFITGCVLCLSNVGMFSYLGSVVYIRNMSFCLEICHVISRLYRLHCRLSVQLWMISDRTKKTKETARLNVDLILSCLLLCQLFGTAALIASRFSEPPSLGVRLGSTGQALHGGVLRRPPSPFAPSSDSMLSCSPGP